MASMRDIKRRRDSIQSTGQITKAMKLVSTVKLQKAKGKAESTKPYFDLMYDTGKNMLAKSGNINHKYLKAGDASKKGPFISIDYLQKILTKPMDTLKENDEDIYGHDGINLITPIMGKTHLTLMFQILGFNSNIKHRISLVATEGTVPDANGYMAVELRHNAEGDRQEYPSPGYVSFPLLDVPGYKEGKLQGFKIKMNTINNGEETVTVSYNKSKSTNFPFIQKDISNTKIK